MRPWIVAVSVAAHALVFALMPRAAVVPPREEPIVVTLEPAPIDVVILDDPQPSPSAAPPAAASPTPPTASQTSDATSTVKTAMVSAGRMTGRSGQREIDEIGQREIDYGAITGSIVPSAHVDPNGRPNGRDAGGPPCPSGTTRDRAGTCETDLSKMRFGPQYESSLTGLIAQAADMPAGTPPPPDPVLPKEGEIPPGGSSEVVARVEKDGTVKLGDRGNLQLGARKGPPVNDNGLATVASFDVTDAMMRATGNDPYAAAKLRYLDSTREARVAIGLRYRKEQLEQTAPLMKKNIDRALVLRDARDRRRALYELWSDCEDTEYGRMARALVIGVIRAKFPQGSGDAFTASELAAWKFAPYEN